MSINHVVSLGQSYGPTQWWNSFGLLGAGRRIEEAAANVRREPLDSLPDSSGGQERFDERTRIAQELHDTLLQELFAVSMKLQSAVNQLPANSEEMARFKDVAQLLEGVLERGRVVVQELRSPHTNFSSLGQAFASVPSELGLFSDARFHVVVHGQQSALADGVRDDIYRIGREAIVNAYRHAHAGEIVAELEYRPAGLRVTVRDNGCGIDSETLHQDRTGHWGLLGMRERSVRIGGRLRIMSRPQAGTEVELYVPGRIAFPASLKV